MESNGRSEKMLITPEYAKALLDTQPPNHNRKIMASAVARLARAITDGKWQFNGQAIVVSDDGILLDGQHRLCAIVMAGIPVESMVVFGVARHAMNTLDSGRRRTSGERFAMMGHANGQDIATVCQWIYRYQSVPATGKLLRSDAAGEFPDLLDILLNHPSILQSMVFVGWSKDWTKLVPATTAMFVHFMASLDDAGKADEYVSRVRDGVGLGANHPAYLVRRNFENQMGSRHGRAHRDYNCALFCKGWLAAKHGKTKRLAKWTTKEDFPRFDVLPSYGNAESE